MASEIGLIGGIEKRQIRIADYDPRWPVRFEQHRGVIAAALGDAALEIDHIGSTSVPGLAAKPIIDILVVVANSADEATYLPAMTAAGYLLRVREPDWHEHRMFRTPDLDAHVHVFTRGNLEIERLLLLRDHLRRNVEDRHRYEAVKRALAQRDWSDMNAYAHAKTEVIEAMIQAARDA